MKTEEDRAVKQMLLTLFAFLVESVRAQLRFDVDDLEIEFFYDPEFDETVR